MGERFTGWLIPALLLGTMAYCIAEEITLTTYYPSPRGVYNELRTLGNVQIGRIEPPATGASFREADIPRLHLVQDNGTGFRRDTFRVHTEA